MRCTRHGDGQHRNNREDENVDIELELPEQQPGAEAVHDGEEADRGSQHLQKESGQRSRNVEVESSKTAGRKPQVQDLLSGPHPLHEHLAGR